MNKFYIALLSLIFFNVISPLHAQHHARPEIQEFPQEIQETLYNLSDQDYQRFISIAKKGDPINAEDENFLRKVLSQKKANTDNSNTHQQSMTEEEKKKIRDNLFELQCSPTYPAPYEPEDEKIINILQKIRDLDEDQKSLHPGNPGIELMLAANAPTHTIESKGPSVYEYFPSLWNGERLSAFLHNDKGANKHTITIMKSFIDQEYYTITINANAASKTIDKENNLAHTNLTQELEEAIGFSKYAKLTDKSQKLPTIQGHVKGKCYTYGCDIIAHLTVHPVVLAYLIQEKNSSRHKHNNFLTDPIKQEQNNLNAHPNNKN